MTLPAPLSPTPPVHRIGGIAFMVLALMCFGVLDTTTKAVSAVAPVVMVLWLRYLVQTVLTTAVLGPRMGLHLVRTRRPGMQVLRGLLLMTCSAIAFFSLKVMPVGEFTAIVMLTPLVLTVVAAVALHESISWLRWACVLGGLAGTLLVIRPGEGLFQWVTMLPLLLVVCNTAFQTMTSRLAQTEDPGTMHFWTGGVGLLATSAALPLAWTALPGTVWAALVLIGTFGALGHFLLIMAYTRAPVAVLTPYLYLQIGFAALGGWLAFGHVPDGWSLAGIALIACCGVFGTWLTGREALARRDRREAQSTLEAIAGADVR
jgi:drug/metabolite transporter (DMT)-like permease